MGEKEIVIPAALAGQRLDRTVSMLAGLPRSKVADLIVRGRVLVDGRVERRRAYAPAPGQRVVLVLEPQDSAILPAPHVEVSVLYEDEHVVVVNKDAPRATYPGAGKEGDTVVAGLLAKYPEMAAVGDPDRPGVVHRLDKGTSGLLVFARTKEAYERLREAFASRLVSREYLALVEGWVEEETGTVEAPLARSLRNPVLFEVSPSGKEAVTHYRVLGRYADPERPRRFSLLELRLVTGRTHQIRVHMASIGHPVVGDGDYGARADEGLPKGRLFLHAARLYLRHPVTGEALSFASDLPADLEALLARLSPLS